MKIAVQILVTLALVTAMENFGPVINKEASSFASALSTVIANFYVKQSSTIFISHSSLSGADVKHDLIVENILQLLDAKTSVAWTINNNHYNNSIDCINNVIIIDSYKSWRYFVRKLFLYLSVTSITSDFFFKLGIFYL